MASAILYYTFVVRLTTMSLVLVNNIIDPHNLNYFFNIELNTYAEFNTVFRTLSNLMFSYNNLERT